MSDSDKSTAKQDRLSVGIKLNNDNYVVWEFAMSVMLKARRLNSVLSGGGTANKKADMMLAIHFKKMIDPASKFDAAILNDRDLGASEPTAAVDSDWASCRDTARSVSGFIVTLRGAVITWRSKQQTVVATSSSHAEYIAASELSREMVWIRMLLTEIGFKLTSPSIVFEDNMAAESMTRNDGVTDRSKHINVKWHYVRQCVREGLLQFDRVNGRENPADALTKAATGDMTAILLRAAGISEIQPARRGRLVELTPPRTGVTQTGNDSDL